MVDLPKLFTIQSLLGSYEAIHSGKRSAMKDRGKTREQLVSENEELQRRVVAMESIEAERSRREEDLRRSEAKWRSVAETPRSSCPSLTG